MAASSHATADSVSLMRFRPLSTVSANLAMLGSSKGLSTVHSQKAAMCAARSTESRESIKPASIMGMSAAAALRRLISGGEGGICLGIPIFYRGPRLTDPRRGHQTRHFPQRSRRARKFTGGSACAVLTAAQRWRAAARSSWVTEFRARHWVRPSRGSADGCAPRQGFAGALLQPHFDFLEPHTSGVRVLRVA